MEGSREGRGGVGGIEGGWNGSRESKTVRRSEEEEL
jgi:hypothetical protein